MIIPEPVRELTFIGSTMGVGLSPLISLIAIFEGASAGTAILYGVGIAIGATLLSFWFGLVVVTLLYILDL